jgi:hypothetical protein
MIMKTQPSIRQIAFGLVLVAMIFALAVPAGAVFAAEDDESPIRFKVVNESQFEFSLWIWGPSKYEISLDPYTEAEYWLDRGWYAFTMLACNDSAVGTMDFTHPQTLLVPVCGGTAGVTGASYTHMDASDWIRPVKIKIRNKTDEPIGLYIRTVEDHHFLTVEEYETTTLLLNDSKSEYVYSYVACDKLHTGYFKPNTIPFDLYCGKK